MKRPPIADRRHRERGAVAIIVAAMLTTLFGFAALAVDAGFWYTRYRSLQAIADAAVAAGMRDLPTSSVTAINSARSIATSNGYAGATITSPAANQLRVQVSATNTSFFGAMFGVPTRTITATATGQLNPNPPAIMGLGGCATTGVRIQGNGLTTINGAVQSNGPLGYSNGCPGVPTVTTVGPAQSACGAPTVSDPTCNTFSGGIGAGGPFSNPFSSITPASFTCTVNVVGDLAINPGGLYEDMAGNLANNTYCATGNITVSGAGAGVLNGVVSFVAGGQVIIGANTTSTLTARQNNIVAYSQMVSSCAGTPAINLGNNFLTLNGSLYAPNGCINAGGTAMTVNGSFVGSEVFVGFWGPWTFNAGGAGGGGNWRMLQ